MTTLEYQFNSMHGTVKPLDREHKSPDLDTSILPFGYSYFFIDH
jgi:hypothetical protein